MNAKIKKNSIQIQLIFNQFYKFSYDYENFFFSMKASYQSFMRSLPYLFQFHLHLLNNKKNKIMVIHKYHIFLIRLKYCYFYYFQSFKIEYFRLLLKNCGCFQIENHQLNQCQYYFHIQIFMHLSMNFIYYKIKVNLMRLYLLAPLLIQIILLIFFRLYSLLLMVVINRYLYQILILSN